MVWVLRGLAAIHRPGWSGGRRRVTGSARTKGGRVPGVQDLFRGGVGGGNEGVEGVAAAVGRTCMEEGTH